MHASSSEFELFKKLANPMKTDFSTRKQPKKSAMKQSSVVKNQSIFKQAVSQRNEETKDTSRDDRSRARAPSVFNDNFSAVKSKLLFESPKGAIEVPSIARRSIIQPEAQERAHSTFGPFSVVGDSASAAVGSSGSGDRSDARGDDARGDDARGGGGGDSSDARGGGGSSGSGDSSDARGGGSNGYGGSSGGSDSDGRGGRDSDGRGGDYDKYNTQKSEVDASLKVEIASEKQGFLLELLKFKNQGIDMTRTYTMDDELSDIQFECDRIRTHLETVNNVNMIRDGLMFAFQGIEFANKQFGPVLQLDGWSANARKDKQKYNHVIERLYKKHWRYGNMTPEVEFGWLIASSMLMHHFKSKFMGGALKSSSSADDEDEDIKKPAKSGFDLSSIIGGMLPKFPGLSQPKAPLPTSFNATAPGPNNSRPVMRGPSSSSPVPTTSQFPLPTTSQLPVVSQPPQQQQYQQQQYQQQQQQQQMQQQMQHQHQQQMQQQYQQQQQQQQMHQQMQQQMQQQQQQMQQMMAYNRDMQNQLASYKEELSRINKPTAESVPVRVASVPVSLPIRGMSVPVRGMSVPRFEPVNNDSVDRASSSDEDLPDTNIPEEDEELDDEQEEEDTGKQISILGTVKSKAKAASSSAAQGRRGVKPVKLALKL